jgi:hypothetical protein
MRHVKLRPGHQTNAGAVAALIEAAYLQIKRQVRAGAGEA